MYSIFAFLLTTIEMGAVLAGFALQNQLIFFNMLVYGSPFYLIQHSIGPSSIINEKNPIYIAFLVFHVVKYFVIFQAQRLDEPNIMRRSAILFEGIYIALSTYYLL
jgi:hypothetical protein